MHLERLEINGFKSFSDRSELAFDRGVTAIVGPNGCGKSNVADAITWVMGEQSAKSLRGERMEDVIFNGSDARKPTAAAEVRLRFSGVITSPNGHVNGHGSNGHGGHANGHEHAHQLLVASDTLPEFGAGLGVAVDDPPAADEIALLEPESVARDVEVIRRLYRSGESEYLIDGHVCRLRDIHDLLMDTGLGAKAYAIIEQGKIGMILSARPTDRRQLIEEAAGVTKYKSRRRSAELKLEAAQQNLTRIDDIAFEIEKQRGALKRQAGKARRYGKLRDELRRWEKVLFARKYRQLAETITSALGRLRDARERESAAGSRVAEIESNLSRIRIELVEADARATASREAAHARELEITRLQQQTAFDREQVQALGVRAGAVAAELETLAARREPALAALSEKRAGASAAGAERDRAAESLATESGSYDAAHREIEGFEADVEAARSEVFSGLNSATALRHSLEHAALASNRVSETLSKLQIEDDDVRLASDRVEVERSAVAARLKRAQEGLDAVRIARAARESELASARIEHEWRARSVRSREQELAGLDARLASLRELEAARAGYGDAARKVLAQANGQVNQRGAVADYLEVSAGFERAVEACLGDLLQHVIVERPEYAEAGLDLVRTERVGRCGFLVVSECGPERAASAVPAPVLQGLIPLSQVVTVTGPFAGAIRVAIDDAWIAESFAQALEASRLAPAPVATVTGDVFHRAHQISGGTPGDARGILETKRDIKELVDRIHVDRTALFRLREETAQLEATIAQASSAIAALNVEHHRQEKTIVGDEAQLQHAVDEAVRLAQKREQLARERRQAEEERESLDRRQEEGRAAIARLEAAQSDADDRLNLAQRRLLEAREAVEDLSRRAAQARADHAALVERAGALAAEVRRLEEASEELESRAGMLATELQETRARAEALREAIAAGEVRLDEEVLSLDAARDDVRRSDEAVGGLRANADEHETVVKAARADFDVIRRATADLDVARATAESDLAHLSAAAVETVQATLDEVLAEVDEAERAGNLTPDARIICADEPEDDEGQVVASADASVDAGVEAAQQRTLSAEEAIVRLREKIDRLGPVNMMAIEQFDELEQRHTFLTAQRTDLVDSIAQTSQAIKRIDETTRQRFSEAFAAINKNFQELFSTLFGGGRAGLTLLDENDPLESGIEIIAQPPGKRLQSVQLLSGGEKALTAISLMFGLFKYKPSPFCLLDEIDAPLDDANIGRFVEMLRGMQQHTQFILITHNRKTMEIADRLYGVTMEEPGVSKLISVQLN